MRSNLVLARGSNVSHSRDSLSTTTLVCFYLIRCFQKDYVNGLPSLCFNYLLFLYYLTCLVF